MSDEAPARLLHVTKRFGATSALADATLEVPAGSVFAILGPNGAGKSTALRLLLNLERPTSGTAELLGRDSRRLKSSDFQSVGYVCESQRVPEFMRVGAFLAYCREFYPSWRDDDASRLVDSLQLPLDQRIRSLSKGAKAKVALASALSYRPRLLLLDEPFASLDVLVREQVTESILDRVPETTVVLVTHDLSDIESFASHVAYLDQGRLLFVEEIESLLGRFRRVEITFAGPPKPETLPLRWICPEWTGVVARFVDTGFNSDRGLDDLRERLAGIQNISIEPMTLRSVFVALAGSQARTKS
jgi:ABC-2 type transport system ATP-binding protein